MKETIYDSRKRCRLLSTLTFCFLSHHLKGSKFPKECAYEWFTCLTLTFKDTTFATFLQLNSIYKCLVKKNGACAILKQLLRYDMISNKIRKWFIYIWNHATLVCIKIYMVISL